MASVKTLYDAQGKARGYRVRWRDSAGRSRSETFPAGAKTDADRYAVKVERDKHTGAELDDRRLTVSEWRDEWTKVQLHRPTTAVRVHFALEPLVAGIGDKPLIKVRQSDIRAWLARRHQTVSLRTVRADMTWVRALFRAAVADRLIAFSPCDGIRLESPERRPQVVAVSAEQIDAVTARLPASWAVLGWLGARTGLRPGELLGLHLEQVDFLRLKVSVDRQLVQGRVEPQTKSSSGRRTVPVDADTIGLLAKHLAVFPAAPSGLIFHHGGRPLSHRSVCATWRAASGGEFRLHDMRHYYASRLIRQGASIVLVSRLLGHSRPSITSDVYAHEFADADDLARTLAGAAFGGERSAV
jgi:integrase